jgi:hypothetical protein
MQALRLFLATSASAVALLGQGCGETRDAETGSIGPLLYAQRRPCQEFGRFGAHERGSSEGRTISVRTVRAS